jgi:hypothetical protein
MAEACPGWLRSAGGSARGSSTSVNACFRQFGTSQGRLAWRPYRAKRRAVTAIPKTHSAPPVAIDVSAQIPAAPIEPSWRVIAMIAKLIARGPEPQVMTKAARANSTRSGMPKGGARRSSISRQTVTVTPVAMKTGATTINRKNTNPEGPFKSPASRIALAAATTAQKSTSVIAAGT